MNAQQTLRQVDFLTLQLLLKELWVEMCMLYSSLSIRQKTGSNQVLISNVHTIHTYTQMPDAIDH